MFRDSGGRGEGVSKLVELLCCFGFCVKFGLETWSVVGAIVGVIVLGSPVLRVRVKGWFFGCWGVWLVPDISSAAWSTTTTAPGTLSRQAPHRPLAGSCPEALPEPTSPLYGACQSEIAANGSDDSTRMYSRPHQSRVRQRAGLCDDCQDLNKN
jgi:hypothetical protein